MNSNPDSQNLADYSEDIEMSDDVLIDEFFRQLEAKEKDLDISSATIIEIEDGEYSDAVSATEEISEPVQPSVEPKTAVAPVVVQDDVSSKLEVLTLRNEVRKLQDRVMRYEDERAEMFTLSRRRQDEFDNYRSRTEREREEIFRNQLGNLALELLPVVDNMNRALDSTKNFSEEKSTEFQQFYEGVELVSLQLNEVLAEMGVEPIIAVGENFDPHLHEAVVTEETGEVAPNTVIEELVRGYRLGEKIIRPSMVKVSVASAAGSEEFHDADNTKEFHDADELLEF